MSKKIEDMTIPELTDFYNGMLGDGENRIKRFKSRGIAIDRILSRMRGQSDEKWNEEDDAGETSDGLESEAPAQTEVIQEGEKDTRQPETDHVAASEKTAPHDGVTSAQPEPVKRRRRAGSPEQRYPHLVAALRERGYKI